MELPKSNQTTKVDWGGGGEGGKGGGGASPPPHLSFPRGRSTYFIFLMIVKNAKSDVTSRGLLNTHLVLVMRVQFQKYLFQGVSKAIFIRSFRNLHMG